MIKTIEMNVQKFKASDKSSAQAKVSVKSATDKPKVTDAEIQIRFADLQARWEVQRKEAAIQREKELT